MRGICFDCYRPTNRTWQAYYCYPCKILHRKAAASRYAKSPKGHATDSRSTCRPRRKLMMAAWVERNIEKVRAYKRKYRLKHRLTIIVKCQSICDNIFIRNGKRGAKRYCDTCVEAFYGRKYMLRRKAA
jgi:hypothetical protein